MPKLFPPVSLSSISNEGERAVLEHLMVQLPEKAHVYHNFDLLTEEYRNGGGARVHLEEGEIDAIVLMPDSSIVVVEVKGRGLRYNNDNNQWQRNKDGRWKPEKSPFYQARSNTHRLTDCIEKRLGSNAGKRIRHGYMVVFPFSELRGELLHEIHPTIYCNGSGLDQLGRRVQTVPDKLALDLAKSCNTTSTLFSVKEIHNAILPAMHLVHSLKASVDADVKTLLRLTGEQNANLDLLSLQIRALIQGVAVSGKTVLAVEQARRFAAQGKCVLLLCYNSALASWVSSGVRGKWCYIQRCEALRVWMQIS